MTPAPSSSVRLDPLVEVGEDDQGRIVLLPPDERTPLRLGRAAEVWLDALREGVTARPPSELQGLLRQLDRAGMLEGRTRSDDSGILQAPSLARVLDRIAASLTRPFQRNLTVSQRGCLLLAALLLPTIGLSSCYWQAAGMVFASVLTPHWWIGVFVTLAAVPLLHELSHALVARLFSVEVTGLGIRTEGGLTFSPFVTVRRAVLSTNPTVRVWIPLAGVLGDLWMAWIATLCLRLSADGSLLQGVAGMLVLTTHVRVLIDGGPGLRSDATQALHAARQLCEHGHRSVVWAVRGGHVLFCVLTCGMLLISLRDLRLA